ncbi:MAG: P-II family nitrogen regulator [Clostridia bacterium]|nr:P-II family nitrogen regulator [Clostridia bacterium]
MEFKHEVIFCIVNAGFSEAVMDAAREVGARGGTVLHASGTANTDAEKIFGITIQPEKDVVMILVSSEIRDKVLHALYESAGLKTEGQGIAFALPVQDVVGLTAFTPVEKPTQKSTQPTEPQE